jgi:hypothetical protein
MKVNTGGSSYINDDSFKIRFLHLELFNAKKAAIRLANFVQVVFELFGSQTLRRPLHLSDFTREELRVFNRGRIQLLPYRDRAGRRVIVGFPPQGDHDQVNHLTRVSFSFRKCHCKNSTTGVMSVHNLKKRRNPFLPL